MRRLFLASMLLGWLLLALPLHAQLELPYVSPQATVTQRIGLTDITVRYSRPSSKGRVIWGGVVPFGELWRTGANAATSIEFNHEITIAGKKLEPGKYSLFSIPQANEWTIVLNKNTDLWGTAGYDQALDVLRFAVPVAQGEFTETFTIDFGNLKENSATLDLRWDEVVVHIPISVNVATIVEENITMAVSNAWRTYAAAAEWYVNRNQELPRALQLSEKSILLQEDTWNWHVKSRCLAKLNDMPAAIAAAEKSLALAQQAKNDFYIQANQRNLLEWRMQVPAAPTAPARKGK